MPESTPAKLAERLKKEGEKVIAYFSALPEEQWQTQIYTEGHPVHRKHRAVPLLGRHGDGRR